MKFKFGGKVTVSAYTEVEADGLEEALKIARGRYAEIGSARSGVLQSEVWVIEEADGMAHEIYLDSAT